MEQKNRGEKANYEPKMISAKKTPEKSRYPIHCMVWHNKHRQLEKALSVNEQVDVEALDPRGRTPLHLAVTLGHLDCAHLLLQHGADVSKENRNGWTVLQEAVSTRDPELVRLVLHYRDYQRTTKRLAGIPVLLERLHQALVTQMSSPAVTNPQPLTAEEYALQSQPPLGTRDIGHPCQLTHQDSERSKWHPSLTSWPSPCPLRQAQGLHYPADCPLAFPVKIEIPIYHILNARITFGNLNGARRVWVGDGAGPGGGEVDGPERTAAPRTDTDTPSPGSDSSSVSSSSSTTSCRGGEIPPCVFEPPQESAGAGSEYDQVTIWEALTNSKPSTRTVPCDPSRLQRTPQHRPCPPASLCNTPPKKPPTACSYDQQLRLAMELSLSGAGRGRATATARGGGAAGG
ncbi:hypothetical protein J4Q44_G00330580 [Coregonus suidteri]|uniref:Ankyrin repeat domain-containing protein n=1 Tax=Coregonus suidteri TaxID=861788 RepID=A0AAN8QFF2_9TELE